ncbi:potassium/proton antiporter [Breznakia pachnodae]|uniref:Cell volume regulation protein A n=1 Tax=Breznakia pachnodae TaxID=265178 RepID=A0ABU0E2G0_9FIRM|nr:potassium/proton antiporter [Breznakia pachnodae]MDQ0361075.1 cell volume regulation protein A [Breznakia pachnodae]
MNQYLLIVAIITIICIVSSKISAKIGLPSLLLFILIGMLFGSDGIFKIQFDDFVLSEQLCTIALIFIIFYGGFGMNLKSAKPIMGKALLLSTVGTFMTAMITGFLVHFIFKVSLAEGILIGSVIGSTDAASVFSILRGKKLNLKKGLAPLLEMESGSNDPISYMMTTLTLGYMTTNSLSTLPQLLISQIGLGVLCGFAIGQLFKVILEHVKFKNDGLKSILFVAIALLAFALPTMWEGNGFLSVYIVGVMLGNAKLKHKVSLVHFFDGVTQMMQILLFFTLGLLAFPSQIPSVLLPALGVMVIITFIARPITVAILLTPLKVKWNEQLFISWSGLRGAASIVFAILTVVSPAYTSKDIFHVVFVVALLSVAFQGTLLPYMAKKLKVEDPTNDIMKTFNDYEGIRQLSMIQVSLPEYHGWIGKTLADIAMPNDMLIALIVRDGENIFPKGSTVVEEQDSLVLCAPSFHDESGIILKEVIVDEDNDWLNKTLDDIDKENRLLIISIKRNKNIIIPNGETILELHDSIVYMDVGNNVIKRA